MAMLFMSEDLRTKGYAQFHLKCNRLTVCEDYPKDYAMIASSSRGHAAMVAANYERSISSDKENVVTVKNIPVIDVSTAFTFKYLVLHSATDSKYYAVLSVENTDYAAGEAVVLPDFTITLSLTDSAQFVSPDMLWRGYTSFVDRSKKVVLCKDVPKSRSDVGSMQLCQKTLSGSDFEEKGAGKDIRMMLKEQRMPATTKQGVCKAVALVNASPSTDYAVSKISNPFQLPAGSVVDVHGVGLKIEGGEGNPDDPSIKPMGQVQIDTRHPMARDLLYYTLDFKKELVKKYAMPHEGTGITWDAATKNVKFTDTSTLRQHNHIQLGAENDDGNLLGQAVTIIFKFRQPDHTRTKGTVFTNTDNVVYSKMEVDLVDTQDEFAFWGGKWVASSVSTATLKKWSTYAFTRGDDADDSVHLFLDGVQKDSQTAAAAREYSGKPFWIGGFKDPLKDAAWQTFVGELEYFAVWKRLLTAQEVADFTKKPYEVIEDQDHVDKPSAYQAIDDSKSFARNLQFYTCSWVDDIAANTPIYPESSPINGKPTIDSQTDNLLFDADYSGKQWVALGSASLNPLSRSAFSVTLKFKVFSSAKTKTLKVGLWGFKGPFGATQFVEAYITGSDAAGYYLHFTVGTYSLQWSVTWDQISKFQAWTFTFEANKQMEIYRGSTRIANKAVVGATVDTVGGIRVGWNHDATYTAIPAEVEYVSVWNERFDSARIGDFLDFPYAHLTPAELLDKKPLGKGKLNHNLSIVSKLGTYVMNGETELVRNRALTVEGKASLPPEVDFTNRDTVFKIRTVKIANSYNTPAYITGYRTGYEPKVYNRTAVFRCKLRPKPSGAPAGVDPNRSTLFCCADTDAFGTRWHVYYGGAGSPAPELIFEFGHTWVKYKFPVAKALNFHDFAFVQEYSVEGTTDYITLSIWIDGERVAVNKSPNKNPSDVDNLDFRLGGYKNSIVGAGAASNYSRFKGTVESYGTWSRALSEAEIKKLHREPYAMVDRNLTDKPNPDTHNISIAKIGLTTDLFFYTLDFKKELVNDYDMEKVGNQTYFLADTHNVKMEDNRRNNWIYLMPSKPGTAYQPRGEVTIVWRSRRIDDANAWRGNYFCSPQNKGSSLRTSSHVAKPDNTNMQLIIDPGNIKTNRLSGYFPHGGKKLAFFTMALRIKDLGGGKWQYRSYGDGKMLKEAVHNASWDLLTDWRFAIGGWNDGSGYRGAKMEMEYFAFWSRALTDDEMTYVTENPYAIVSVAPKESDINPVIALVDSGDD